jgi:outer membrane protein insertion porin family
MKYFFIAITLLLASASGFGQISTNAGMEDIDYSSPRTYIIGGVTVSGVKSFDNNALRAISGLEIGKEIKIPSDDITNAISNLWKQDLFTDIEISATEIIGDKIFLDIYIAERPRLSKFRFTGVKKGKQETLREEIKLVRGKLITENLLESTRLKVQKFYTDKGYLNATVKLIEVPDTLIYNSVILTIAVDKGERVKIKELTIEGNEALSDRKIKRLMKDTKEKKFYNLFKTSKLVKPAFKKDKQAIIAKYNAMGYRDAKIMSDSTYKIDQKNIGLKIKLKEGEQYYFGDIKWVGNTKYTNEELDKILNIDKGEVYNQELMDQRLFMDPNGRDISSLYLDQGYLFFQPDVVETGVRNDSIDFEIRLREGKQATVNKITIKGNTKTNDHVILREIRTRPGELFSRADIIRTNRELAQLGYFNQETIGVNPIPNQENGTVDIEYVVEERPSDQIELSGGWGGNRVVGSLGVSFNNFSARNFFKKGAWQPLPAGDGQKLSLRAQSNGRFFQSYNASFTEPWLGGRKPNSLSVSIFHSVQSNGESKRITVDGQDIKNPDRQSIYITGASVGLGRRLEVPDDFFTLYNEISYQYYTLDNYNTQFVFSDGFANNLSFKTVLSRNSIDAPIYPRSGSQTSFSLQFTPPYSVFDGDRDYDALETQERYKFIEYHKWKFNTSWFTSILGDLVLNTKMGFGFLGLYNRELGQSPFERFYLGGDGLSNFALDGREIIALRGYGNGDLSPNTGASVVSKYTMELRYPVSLNPQATIYGLAFAEAGNSWGTFSDFKPFEVRRSAGVGVRIFMPMFGLLGLDWGYRFDDIPGVSDPNNRTEIHFTIGGSLNGW